jgi:hypothetical protein
MYTELGLTPSNKIICNGVKLLVSGLKMENLFMRMENPFIG